MMKETGTTYSFDGGGRPGPGPGHSIDVATATSSHFRSRYSIEETSPFNPDNDRRYEPPSLCGWVVIDLTTFFCSSKRRMLYLCGVIVVTVATINSMFPSSSSSVGGLSRRKKKNRSFDTAYRQSYGFFDDVPKNRWDLLRDRVKTQSSSRSIDDPSKYSTPSEWYQSHWNPDFTCPNERRVGGVDDAAFEETKGSKWVCDPHRIAEAASERQRAGGNGCTVYASGRPREFRFERALLELMGGPSSCEIHVFMPAELGAATVPESIYLHPWGFKGSQLNVGGKQQQQHSSEGAGGALYKTVQETVIELGHPGRTIDVLMLDCEGCEWDTYADWFDVGTDLAFLQILVETHGAPPAVANDFFMTLKSRGYVTFHKEANVRSNGNFQEYSFLKLSPEFFDA